MQVQVYRTMGVLSNLVEPLPIGTNLGLMRVFWMMLSGQLLTSRGAVIPGLDALGLPEDAVRRAWAALGKGAWQTPALVTRWQDLVAHEGIWVPHCHGGFHPVAVDLTHFLRPRLIDCQTKYYSPKTGQSITAIPVGLIVRVGQVGTQRLGIPTAMVRAPEADPSPQAHLRALVRQAVNALRPDEMAVLDRGFPVSTLQAEGCDRYVVRAMKNLTARRAVLPAYRGTGRRPKYGELVRPLARTRQGRVIPATPPARVEVWQEDGFTLRAAWWHNLVLSDAVPGSPTFSIVAIYDPRYVEPLLLVTPLQLSGAQARLSYLDRWPVEQVPLAGKQMIGAHRQFVHAPETRQRLPEVSLLAGSVLSYLAATLPAAPTGFWDRKPQPTAGRLRRVLAKAGFPEVSMLPDRIRKKASATEHLPKGHFGQRRRIAVRPLAVGA